MDVINPNLMTQFFHTLFRLVKEARCEVLELWHEVSELSSIMDISNQNLKNLVSYCDFVKIEKTNYTEYISIDKLSFLIESMKFLNYDIKSLSEMLDYNGFEALIAEILKRNNMKTTNNFRFSDKSYLKYKTKQKRYEIDVIGVKSKLILVIDGKQWKKKDPYSAINKAANLQFQRVEALKNNPDIFADLLQKLIGNSKNMKRYLPFTILPMMCTFEESGYKLNNQQIPLVSIAKLNAFIQELPRTLDYFKTIKVKRINVQKTLF